MAASGGGSYPTLAVTDPVYVFLSVQSPFSSQLGRAGPFEMADSHGSHSGHHSVAHSVGQPATIGSGSHGAVGSGSFHGNGASVAAHSSGAASASAPPDALNSSTSFTSGTVTLASMGTGAAAASLTAPQEATAPVSPAGRHHRRGKSHEGTRGSSSAAVSAGSLRPSNSTPLEAENPFSWSLDASWQLLGWEHPAAGQANAPRVSAADTILKALLSDFSEHTQSKLEEIMKFGIVRRCAPLFLTAAPEDLFCLG